MLSNPLYIHHLAAQKYLEDEDFVRYLDYLQYFKEPEYIRYLQYAHNSREYSGFADEAGRYPGPTLRALELLQQEQFRKDIISPALVDTMVREGFEAATAGLGR